LGNITFIIPAFNCADSVTETLDSIFNGNFRVGDEVIVVDDGSTDDTRDVLQRYSSGNHRLKIITHATNKGGAEARNTAVKNATNELIFCLDSDNVLQKSSVHDLKTHLIAEKASCAAFGELWYFKNSIDCVTHKWIFPARQISFEDCLASNIVPISSGNYLYTKESWRLAGGYPEFAGALDAWGFGMRQLGNGQKMVVLEGTGYFHRYGHQSYWVREDKKKSDFASCSSDIAPIHR